MVILRKTILFQGSRGGPTFSRGGGGSNFFQGWGVQMLISIETYRACDFPGEWVRTPYPPLRICTCSQCSYEVKCGIANTGKLLHSF